MSKKYRITFFSQKHILSDAISTFHFFSIFRSAKNFEEMQYYYFHYSEQIHQKDCFRSAFSIDYLQ